MELVCNSEEQDLVISQKGSMWLMWMPAESIWVSRLVVPHTGSGVLDIGMAIIGQW